jgi:hypothetical protein
LKNEERINRIEETPFTGLDGFLSPTQERKSLFTVKVTSKNPLALSKFLNTIRAQFKPLMGSRVMYSPSTKEYFAYLDFSNAEILDKLQEVSPFPC